MLHTYEIDDESKHRDWDDLIIFLIDICIDLLVVNHQVMLFVIHHHRETSSFT